MLQVRRGVPGEVTGQTVTVPQEARSPRWEAPAAGMAIAMWVPAAAERVKLLDPLPVDLLERPSSAAGR